MLCKSKEEFYRQLEKADGLFARTKIYDKIGQTLFAFCELLLVLWFWVRTQAGGWTGILFFVVAVVVVVLTTANFHHFKRRELSVLICF
jgi:uncharacterized membrane protein